MPEHSEYIADANRIVDDAKYNKGIYKNENVSMSRGSGRDWFVWFSRKLGIYEEKDDICCSESINSVRVNGALMMEHLRYMRTEDNKKLSLARSLSEGKSFKIRLNESGISGEVEPDDGIVPEELKAVWGTTKKAIDIKLQELRLQKSQHSGTGLKSRMQLIANNSWPYLVAIAIALKLCRQKVHPTPNFLQGRFRNKSSD